MKTSHSHSLVTIDDLSMNDRVIGDLPSERLAIECLPFSSATMTKKRTKSVLRNTFSNSGLAIPIFVEVMGPLCFSALSSHFSGYKCSTLLFEKAQQRFCCCSAVLSSAHRSGLTIWIVTLQCDRALVTTSVVIRRVVGDVDRREVVQVPATSFLPPIRQLVLSNGLPAIVDLRASFLLDDSLVQNNTALSKLEIWL